jgi:hypothetical protein
MPKRVVPVSSTSRCCGESQRVSRTKGRTDIDDLVAVVRAGADTWVRDVYGVRMVERYMRGRR